MKPIIEVRDISKKFFIDHERPAYLSLRDRIASAFEPSTKQEEFWALKDVSFDVMPGDSIGIIGKNGAGKSTLLKVLSRITPPTDGTITIRGRIASLLEVGTGFHQELTGRENIFMNGSILGMKRQEIKQRFDEMVDFSGVEKFLDTPLKNYSSGMQLRLAFAVAAHLDPEILIIDEVLAVGDAEFQKKCLGKMEDVSKSGRTILFVSHDLNYVSSLCKNVIVLKNGSISFFDETIKSLAFYQHEFLKKGQGEARKPKKTNSSIYISNIKVCNTKHLEQTVFFYNESVLFDFSICIEGQNNNYDLFVIILDSKKRRVFSMESNELKETMKLVLEPGILVRGSYSITAFINKPNIAQIDVIEDVGYFEIVDNGSQMMKHGTFDYGSVFGKGKWI